MSDILVRDVDARALQKLKARAKRNGRSLQGEAKLILEHAAGQTLLEALAAAEKWRMKLAKPGQHFTNSAGLIREARDR